MLTRLSTADASDLGPLGLRVAAQTQSLQSAETEYNSHWSVSASLTYYLKALVLSQACLQIVARTTGHLLRRLHRLRSRFTLSCLLSGL